MDNAIEMCEIETHSQSSCRNDNLDFFVFELCDYSGFFFMLNSSMKHSRGYVTVAKEVKHVVKKVFCSTINQYSLTFHNFPGAQVLDQCSILILCSDFTRDCDVKILVERG